jgi:hypothetical protein
METDNEILTYHFAYCNKLKMKEKKITEILFQNFVLD